MDSQPTIAEQQLGQTGVTTAIAVLPAASGKGSASVHLHGRALMVARTVWIVAAAASWLIFVVAIPARYAQLTSPSPQLRQAIEQLGVSVDFYALYILSLEISLGIACGLVGLIIFLRRRAEVIALLVSFLNVIFGIACFPVSQTIYALQLSQPAYAFPFRLLHCIAWMGAITSLYLFPDGRFVPRWSRFTIVPLIGLFSIIWVFFPESPLNAYNIPLDQGMLLWGLLWAFALAAVIYRFVRVSSPMQRQQTKWVVFGTLVGAIVGFSVVVLGILVPEITPPGPPGHVAQMIDMLPRPSTSQGVLYTMASSTILYLCLFLTPVAYAISITRYRLWDIDILINRALVYVPLTGIVAGLYAASTAFLQKLFLTFTGQQSDAAIVLTTLIIAATFTPIKNGLQRTVDKRFKPAPDSMSRLKALGNRMHMVGDVIDPQRLMQHVLDEAVGAYRASGGAIYLARDAQAGPAHATEHWHPDDAELSLHLKSGDAHIGTLKLGPRADGNGYSSQDHRTLEHIAGELAHILRLTQHS
jgi:hypothetical protein